VSFRQRKISCLRGSLTHSAVYKNIEFRRRWESINRTPEFTADVQMALLEMCDLLAAHRAQHNFKLVFNENWLYMYAEDLDFVDKIRDLPAVSGIDVREALATIPHNVIQQLNPEYQYRVYLRERQVDDSTKQRLADWLRIQPQDQVRGSPSLRSWLKSSHGRYGRQWNNNFCQRYYYVDFQDQASITMLGLLVGNLVRNTCRIEARQ
jgi:hypothetical protein